MKKIITAICLIVLGGCTKNVQSRQFGGKEEITLKKNEVLMNITWKSADMWVLTEDTTTHVKYFREHSSFGILEGEITIKNP